MGDADRTTEQDPLVEILAKVRSIDSRLTQLETTVAERLRETRPIWEVIAKDVTAIKESQERIEEEFGILARRQLSQDAEIALLKRRGDRSDVPTERMK